MAPSLMLVTNKETIKNLLKSAKISNVNKLFGKDAEFMNKSARYAKRINEKAADLLYTELTQTGLYVNGRG